MAKEKNVPGVGNNLDIYILPELDEYYDFAISEKRYADFLIMLNRDGFSRNQFFKGLVYLYLINDKSMINTIESLKRMINGASNKKEVVKRGTGLAEHAELKRDLKKKEELENSFTLTAEEVENIFDTIEEEILDF